MWSEFDELEEELAQLPAVHFYESLIPRYSLGQGRWSRSPWLALFDRRETMSVQRGVSVMFRFREDMSGVDLMLSGAADQRAAPGEIKDEIRSATPRLTERFRLDDDPELAEGRSVIAHKFYGLDALPSDDEIEADLRLLLDAYRQYVDGKMTTGSQRDTSFDLAAAMKQLIATIAARGFHYEPWQIAAFVTAIRTKPFVILAGITGTGKSKLPSLIADAVGASCKITPVRSDWTDSGDVIGFTNIRDKFQPGALLRAARNAGEDREHMHFFVLDEMNIARVEHYAPELLSVIESREFNEQGEVQTRPLWSTPLSDDEQDWQNVGLPSNFAVVGTVNMDESSHPFSRKVLDRAFTIELSSIRLADRRTSRATPAAGATWPLTVWSPRAIQLDQLQATPAEDQRVNDVIATLVEFNRSLTPAQLQIGYRSRDEIVLFVLNADEIRESFGDVDPLDLALHMKVLPRLIGGSVTLRSAMTQLIGLTTRGEVFRDDHEAQDVVDQWIAAGRPESLAGSRFPFTAARLSMMIERLTFDGATSFWL